MKTVTSILLIFNFFCNSLNLLVGNQFSFEIFDSDYSMAYTMVYSVNDSNITVRFQSQVENEQDSIVLAKHLSAEEKQYFVAFFSNHNVYTLKDEYRNRLIDDGDQKRIVFKNGGKIKTIQVANYYQPDIRELFDIVNRVVERKYKISYLNKKK